MLKNKLTAYLLSLGMMLSADSSSASMDADQEVTVKTVTLDQFQSLGEQPDLRQLMILKGLDTKTPHSIAGIHQYPLEELEIEFTRNLDSSPLGHLKRLNRLCVKGADMPTDPATITQMKAQLKIKVPKDNIYQFEFLRYLTNLTALQVAMGSFDLGVISGLPQLSQINLSYCDFSKTNPRFMEVFATLPSLRILKLELGRELTDVSGLSKCMNLVTLIIPMTDVKSIEPLRGLPIQFLDVSGCGIKDISPLADLKKLQLLAVSEPAHEGWDGLRAHPSLRRIKVTTNVLLSPSPEKLAIVKQLDTIALDDPTPENLKLLEDADRIIGESESYPTQVLKTVPQLEMIAVPEHPILREFLEDFKKNNPNVVFGQFADWSMVDINSLPKNGEK
ncbi:MAG: hypothetical protein KBB83_05215 [Alphaproteobacteria bacterium]|nr:hypothetical protein [Alphaproteobacteria bacterium]